MGAENDHNENEIEEKKSGRGVLLVARFTKCREHCSRAGKKSRGKSDLSFVSIVWISIIRTYHICVVSDCETKTVRKNNSVM